jgi:hypothetical protein
MILKIITKICGNVGIIFNDQNSHALLLDTIIWTLARVGCFKHRANYSWWIAARRAIEYTRPAILL